MLYTGITQPISPTPCTNTTRNLASPPPLKETVNYIQGLIPEDWNPSVDSEVINTGQLWASTEQLWDKGDTYLRVKNLIKEPQVVRAFFPLFATLSSALRYRCDYLNGLLPSTTAHVEQEIIQDQVLLSRTRQETTHGIRGILYSYTASRTPHRISKEHPLKDVIAQVWEPSEYREGHPTIYSHFFDVDDKTGIPYAVMHYYFQKDSVATLVVMRNGKQHIFNFLDGTYGSAEYTGSPKLDRTNLNKVNMQPVSKNELILLLRAFIEAGITTRENIITTVRDLS